MRLDRRRGKTNDYDSWSRVTSQGSRVKKSRVKDSKTLRLATLINAMGMSKALMEKVDGE
ncbi:hypothetical protein M1N54_05285 [Thermodesulfovibrionales bacterium]|nr:hypothetical protein [Thermodesulfovibrionales bacterium]